MLDAVLHLGLRLASGAFRTSPIESLYAETDQWCLEHQRTYMALLYCVRATSLNSHPLNAILENKASERLFLSRPSLPLPFSIRVKVDAEELGVILSESYKADFVEFMPPWQLRPVTCDMSFKEIYKKHSPAELIRQHFLHLQNKFPYTAFYTDASKTATAVACAAHGPNFASTRTLNRNTSIFTAEAHAILITLEHIIQTKTQQSIIYTDSLSVVTALHYGKPSRNIVLNRLVKEIMAAYALKQVIVVCWVPGHSGIPGNELADQSAAAAALRCSVDVQQLPYLDWKPFIRKAIRQRWQQHWDTQTDNKLHTIKPQLGSYYTEKHNRTTEVYMCRLRIGHTYATHSHLLQGKPPPQCDRCGHRLSVSHVLVECGYFHKARKKHFRELYTHMIPLHPSMFLADQPLIPSKRLFAYLGDIGFLNRISYHV